MERYCTVREIASSLQINPRTVIGWIRDGQLMAYKHESFWQCMDTLREKHILETMWQSGNPPWKVWG